jgi:hypothetical protein
MTSLPLHAHTADQATAAMLPWRREFIMKFEELDEVLRRIDGVLQFCGEESVCGRRLRKKRQELASWKKKGVPVPRGTMLRIVTVVCEVVCEELLKRPDQRV